MAGDFMKSITIVLLHADKYKKKMYEMHIKKNIPSIYANKLQVLLRSPIALLVRTVILLHDGFEA